MVMPWTRTRSQPVSRDGLGGLTLRAVAREAGVSHAAPTHHFGDLTGLVSELAAIGFRQFNAAMAAAGAVDAPRSADRDVLRTKRADERRGRFAVLAHDSRGERPHGMPLRVVLPAGTPLQHRSAAQMQLDARAQDDRTRQETSGGDDDLSATRRVAGVDGALDREGIQRRAVAGRAVIANVEHESPCQ